MDLLTTELESPFTVDKVQPLKLGQRVSLKGRLVACRGDALQDLSRDGVRIRRKGGLGLYHTSPLVIGRLGSWSVYSAGPSVSARSEASLAAVVERFNIHVVIGQGGMSAEMCRVCREQGCVYLQCVGLAGASLASATNSVEHVNPDHGDFDEDGPWILDVAHIESIVAIDANGKSLHRRIQRRAQRNLKALLEKRDKKEPS